MHHGLADALREQRAALHRALDDGCRQDIGRFGAFAQIGRKEDEDKPRFASLRPGQSMHTIGLDEALALFLLPCTLGEDAGEPVSVAIGRFGPFAKRGATYASLGKDDGEKLLENETVKKLVGDAQVKKIIFVPGRLLNIVC